MKNRINVTQSFLPPIEEYFHLVAKIWENHHLTNSGPLHEQLEKEICRHLQQNIVLVANGTIAIQLALKALKIEGEVITTPYSYVATTNSLLWEKCIPVFADIDAENFSIDPKELKKKISSKSKAILATHVYGIPGAIDEIIDIATQFSIPVIFDAAHAFGVKYRGKSILSYGNMSTLSFHATKLFHTVEGGAIAFNDPSMNNELKILRSFGHQGDEYFGEGINGKLSEVHAAMGLVNLNYIDKLISQRKSISEYYSEKLNKLPLKLMKIPEFTDYNYSYYPIFAENNSIREILIKNLEAENIFPRRYFFPSLNTLPYLEFKSCPVSENLASRVICLPLYNGLRKDQQDEIIRIISQTLLV